MILASDLLSQYTRVTDDKKTNIRHTMRLQCKLRYSTKTDDEQNITSPEQNSGSAPVFSILVTSLRRLSDAGVCSVMPVYVETCLHQLTRGNQLLVENLCKR